MKIEEQVLSREQMAHLVELGVDTSDGSMMWYRCDDGNAERWYLQINNELSQSLARIMKGAVACLVPTYTIGDLIKKLPIKIKNGFGEFSRNISIEEEFIDIGYQNGSDYSPTPCFRGSLLEQLYALLCWVAKKHKELIK